MFENSERERYEQRLERERASLAEAQAIAQARLAGCCDLRERRA